MTLQGIYDSVRTRFVHRPQPEIFEAMNAVRAVKNRTAELNEKLEPYLASDDPLQALMTDLQRRRDRLAGFGG